MSEKSGIHQEMATTDNYLEWEIQQISKMMNVPCTKFSIHRIDTFLRDFLLLFLPKVIFFHSLMRLIPISSPAIEIKLVQIIERVFTIRRLCLSMK